MAPVPGDSPKTPAWHIDAVRGPSTPSLDHLVGERNQLVGNLDAERLGGLEVNDQLELDWRLHRQIAWCFAAQDAIEVRRRATPQICYVAAIGDQAAADGEKGERIDRGHTVARRRRDDGRTIAGCEYVCVHDQPPIRPSGERSQGAFDAPHVLDWGRNRLHVD